MPFIPYAVGIFMLTPLFVWAGLWFAFPGPKPGITDAPLIMSLIIMSIPLVLYHYISGLAFIANSMAGHTGETRPKFAPARWVQAAMLPLTLILSLGALTFLYSQGKSLSAMLLVAAAGVALVVGLFKASGGKGRFDIHARLARMARMVAGVGVAVLRKTPFLGPLFLEVERNPRASAPWIAANLVLINGLAIWVFGFSVLVIPAMLAVPVAFYLMIAISAADEQAR